MILHAANTAIHPRWLSVRPNRRRGPRYCPWCPKRTNKATHVGICNGLAMVSGCEWHMRMWLRNPNVDFGRVKNQR